jgi:hypothetical protein
MDELTTALTIFILCGVVGVALAIQRLRRSGWNVVDPVATFGIGFSAYYGISNAWYCVALMTDQMQYAQGWQFDPHSPGSAALILKLAVMTASFGVTLALGAWLVSAFRGRSVSWGPPPPKSERSLRCREISVLAPLAVWGWATSFGVIPSLNGIAPTPIVMLPKLGVLGLLIALCHRANAVRRPGPIAVAIAAVGLSIVLELASAMKENMLEPLVAGLVGVVMASRSWRPIAAAAILSIPLMLLLTGWTATNRSNLWAVGADLSPSGRPGLALTVGFGDVLSVDGVLRSADDFMHRLCTLIPMAETLLMIERNESISVVDGLIVPLTPRLLWPHKPIIDIGERIYQSFSGNCGSSNSPNLPAECYMYGGWLGILVIGMTLGAFAGLLGLLARRYWERRVYTGTAVMVMVALQYGKCEDVLYRYPALLISLIPLLWLVNWFSGAGAAVRSSMQGPSVPIMVRHSPPLQSSRANRSVRHSAERPSHPA